MMLSDFDASSLYLHHSGFPQHPQALCQAARGHGERIPAAASAEVAAELDWLLSVEERACKLTDLYDAGELPLRVTHNDTKINNVLFDEETRKALVVIDLDTVMPGLVGHDFGDAIRFAANFVEEDCPRRGQGGREPERLLGVRRGLPQGDRGHADRRGRWRRSGLSCFALACELATRFLDDYIVGDKYFKIKNAEAQSGAHALPDRAGQGHAAQDGRDERHRDGLLQPIQVTKGAGQT